VPTALVTQNAGITANDLLMSNLDLVTKEVAAL
jgi:hypothetical protein